MRFVEAMQTCIFFKGYDRSLDTMGIGGAERDRTADPLLAKQVLSQLSYSPNHHKHLTYKPPGSGEPSSETKMVGPGRLELPTPRLSSVCSNQLDRKSTRLKSSP